MSRSKIHSLLAIVLFLLCSAVGAQSLTVDYKDGQIHLQASEQPVEAVLVAIADAAGFVLILEGNLNEPVNQKFVLPLGEAIKEITRNHISIMQYATDGDGKRQISELRVYAKVNTNPQPRNNARNRSGQPPNSRRATASTNRTATADRRNEIARLRDALINSNDPAVRRDAVEQLGQMGSTAAVHALSQALRDSDIDVKQQAIAVLGQIGSGQATRSLGRSLRQEQDAETRILVIATLVSIGSPAARNYIESAVRDADENVRQAAEQALQEF